jgi:hypothetical protein
MYFTSTDVHLLQILYRNNLIIKYLSDINFLKDIWNRLNSFYFYILLYGPEEKKIIKCVLSDTKLYSIPPTQDKLLCFNSLVYWHSVYQTITLVYMNFAVSILKLDLYEVLCADSRNVITFVVSHTIV